MVKEKSRLKRVKGDANRYLYRLGNVYWVRAFANGRVLQKSLNTEVLTTARLFRDKEVANFLGEKRSFNTKRKLVEDLFPEFLSTKATKSKSTRESMNNQWKHHLISFSGFFPEEITEGEWIKYVENKRKELPDRKFFNDRKYLMMFLNWCHRNGIIQKLPKLENVDPEIKEGLVYSKEQIKELLKNSNDDLKLQILMGISMGMRIGEIMSLEWYQIDFKKETIHLPAEKTKIRKARTFSISESCLEMLRERRKSIQGLAVFPSPLNKDAPQGRDGNKKAWAACKAKSGVPSKYRFHWLRHTFLTEAFKHSTNPALICHYAGLSLEQAEQTYLHFTTDDTKVVSTLVRIGL